MKNVQLEHFTWCNDFAAAKNYAISKASNDMVMVIDSDEYLDQIDIPALEQMIRKNPDKVGRIKRRNTFEHNEQKPENREWSNRIFSRKRFHYEGRIHEQVVALDGSEDYETYQAPVTILHSGYDLPEKERKKKARRNIELLNQELQGLTQSVLGETGQKDWRQSFRRIPAFRMFCISWQKVIIWLRSIRRHVLILTVDCILI